MARLAAVIGVYLVAGMAFLVAVNEDQQNFDIPFLVVAAAAALVGWVTGDLRWRSIAVWILLPWTLILLGLPFETTNRYTGGECCFEVWEVAIFPALASAVLMLLGAGARVLYEWRRGGGHPPPV